MSKIAHNTKNDNTHHDHVTHGKTFFAGYMFTGFAMLFIVFDLDIPQNIPSFNWASIILFLCAGVSIIIAGWREYRFFNMKSIPQFLHMLLICLVGLGFGMQLSIVLGWG